MKKLKEKMNNFLKGRYGVDEVGKTIFVISIVAYLLGTILQNAIIATLGVMGFIIEFFRMLSKQSWERSEENRKYLEFIRLWKLKYENRKEFRIYRCKRCGRYIRVPKGKGKIQVTCTKCGDKTIRRT